MRSHRGSWLGPWLLAVAFVLMPAVSATVQAQPGYGPDPFWPYNSQYAPYVSPSGPASPEAGQGGVAMPRGGGGGANQFQEYLEGLQGEGRLNSDRANIGMPYYRSAVDPNFDPRGRGPRQYQPNATRANATFEHAQRTVAQRYFAYYSEHDPARRAELMKEYREARRDATRAVSGRSRSPSRLLDSSSRSETGSRRAPSPAISTPRPGATGRTGSSDARIGPAPPVPSVGSSRPYGSTPRRSRPSDVLNRSQAMDLGGGLLPGSRPSPPRIRRPTQPATAPAPIPGAMDSP